MITQNLMSGGGPAILPTALFVLVLALFLGVFFAIALIRSGFRLLAGSSRNSRDRGAGGMGALFGILLVFFALAGMGLYLVYQNATHLMG